MALFYSKRGSENGLVTISLQTKKTLYLNFRTVFEEVNQEAKGKLEITEEQLVEELER